MAEKKMTLTIPITTDSASVSVSDDDTSGNVLMPFDFEETRDETLEIRKLSQKETSRVHTWRIAVTSMLLLTAVAVTSITYILLDREEENNFETAFEQFARTLGDAALEQQHNIHDSMEQFTNVVSAHAQGTNMTWPYLVLPLFESYAQDFKKQSRAELIVMDTLVKHEERDSYIEHANQIAMRGIEESHMLAYGNLDRLNRDPSKYQPFIARKFPNNTFVPDIDREKYFVMVSRSPPPLAYGPTTNFNKASLPPNAKIYEAMLQLRKETLISAVRPPGALPKAEHAGFHTDSEADNPHSFFFRPIHRVVHDYDSDIVGAITVAMAWDASMLDLLPENVEGIMCVIQNTCNQTYTYEINGHDAIYRGEGDIHDPQFDSMEVIIDLSLHTHPNFTSTPGHCQYSMRIFPNGRFKDSYNSSAPEKFAAVIASTFLLVALAFVVYDIMVQRRNEQLVANAARSNAIVSSMFPGMIRDQLIGQNAETKKNKGGGDLKSFIDGNHHQGTDKNKGDTVATMNGTTSNMKPLADLFLETTILFADISGFTAWSSMREPSQVFILLETLFCAFDKIAKKRGVYKIETVGDCYVAATGIPNARADHAVAMARFARDIISRMNTLTKELEVMLGPDTGDLTLRIGMHSGSVTAGVLRGERARFQLFGDTMNTCSRIESTGEGNRIHISQESADLILKAGRQSWLHKREHLVSVKGKSDMQTYWLNPSGQEHRLSIQSFSDSNGFDENEYGGLTTIVYGDFDEKTSRLINWNVDMLSNSIKQIIARRNAQVSPQDIRSKHGVAAVENMLRKKSESFLDEVKEIISLPDFDGNTGRKLDWENIEIPAKAKEQLTDYVICIASLYRENGFHNFEHASHVNMSVIKLLSRIVAPSDLDVVEGDSITQLLHDHTYGITSDPLTQFACSFSALIHDVDHVGVPNATLVKESATIATVYNGRSVAEQNSLAISWDLLMEPKFAELRAVLYSTEAELIRLRELVVNAVMATDIVDKELKELRNNRWDTAFKRTEKVEDLPRDDVNRKATIVIEHLIQASDVSHTMQHWHIYRRWNECFFRENYQMYLDGRVETDPSVNWYKGEIGFFDFYIIPLAKKLKDCGVFGKSSDEYLNYALSNRREWEARGQQVVIEMVERARKELWPTLPPGGENDEVIFEA